MKRVNKKILANLIIKELNRVDPIGLISMGAPRDEYNPEVKEILSKINLCKSEKDLEELMYNTFVKMFDERLAGSREIYRKLSSRIFGSLIFA